MRISIMLDRDYFLAHINGEPALIGHDTYNEVFPGDIIHISSNYKRDWYVNDAHTGLQDREDDAMYSAIYTSVPDEGAAFTGAIVVELKDDDGSKEDTFPYSLLPVHVTSPWGFLGSDGIPHKVSPDTFREDVFIHGLGEMICSATGNKVSVKILKNEEKYASYPNTCGIIRADGGFLFVINESEDRKNPKIQSFGFDTLEDVREYVADKFVKGQQAITEI